MPDGEMKNNEQKKRWEKNNAERGSAVLKAMVVFLVFLIGLAAFLGSVVYNEKPNEDTTLVMQQNQEPNEQMLAVINVDTIYDNITINGLNVGGMTKSEALAALKAKYQAPLDNKTIVLTDDENRFEYPLSTFDASFDFGEAVETAYSYARDGGILDIERYEKIIALKAGKPYEITANYSYDGVKVHETVKALEDEVNVPAQEASISRENGVFHTADGHAGRALDVNATAELVTQLLQVSEGGVTEMVIHTVEPKFTQADLLNAQSLIGTFSTNNTPGNDPRNVNIKNAISKINNVVVYPSEVFSTNHHFGAMTYDNGYRAAPVIVGGKFEDDFGGGVCQVSSTLYMALLYAELEIVERQNHSLKVGYADYGFDATLAGDYIDLKFNNDTDYPVIIESYTEGSKVVVNIYGNEIHPQSRRIVFSNQLVESIAPPETVRVEDSTLALGAQVEVEKSRTGYRYNLIKTVYDGDKEVEKLVVNKSYYKATQGRIRVGTNPDIQTQEQSSVQEPQGDNEIAGDVPSDTVPSDAPPVETAPTNTTPEESEPEVELDLSILEAIRNAQQDEPELP